MAQQTEGFPKLSEEADAEYELESEEGSLWTGTRLLIGLCAMAWAGVAFAYFYLKAVDVGPAWRPHHVTPPPLLGTLIAASVLAGAVLLGYGAFKFHQGLAFEWTVAGWIGVAFGLIAIGLQVWELTRLSFYPGESGYTSVFIGFAGLNIAFVLGGTLWAEMIVARSLRLGSEIGPERYLGFSTQPEVRVMRASMGGCVYFWGFMFAINLLFWILFYIL